MKYPYFVIVLILALAAVVTACAPQAPEGYAYILVTVTPASEGGTDTTTTTTDTASTGDDVTVPLPEGGLPTQPASQEPNESSVDGGDVTAPVNNVSTTVNPNLPEGLSGRIAFMGPFNQSQNLNVFVMNANGTGLTLMTQSTADGYYPSLSPDGTKVAFVAAGATSTDIFVVDVATNVATNVTDLAGTDNQPVWSPDGNQIAFTSDRDGGDTDLWIMNADGSDARRVARTPGSDNLGDWSPDGTQLVYSNQNEVGESLWIMNIASGEFTALTESTSGTNDSSPKWSPDGKEIAFFRDDGSGAPVITTITPDGATLTNLTDGTTPSVFPLYSPDGKWLIYTSIATVNGGQQQQLALLDRTANTTTIYPDLTGFATSWAATDQVLADTGLSQGPKNTGVEVDPAIVEAGYQIGSDDAPIKIVEFSDFQCPYCQRWYTDVYSQLRAYIDDGTVQIVFVDYPLSFHPQADEAAQASHCAAELGGDEAFWKMHDKLFESVNTWSGNNNPNPIFADLATGIGLDGAALEACINSNKYLPTVQAATNEGNRLGVSGTPTFFINGDRVVGAQPWEAFARYLPANAGGGQ